MIFWYCAYARVYNATDAQYLEILALTLIVDWLNTLKYLKFISIFGVILTQLWSILFRDILGIFVLVYVVISVAFGFALHTLNLSDTSQNRTSSTTVFMTFANMLSLESYAYDSSTDDGYAGTKGGYIDFIRIVFSVYICLTTVILLNILIAMMNNTYTQVRSMTFTKKLLSSIVVNFWLRKRLMNKTSKLNDQFAGISKLLWKINKITHIIQPETEVESGRYYLWIARDSGKNKRKNNSIMKIL